MSIWWVGKAEIVALAAIQDEVRMVNGRDHPRSITQNCHLPLNHG